MKKMIRPKQTITAVLAALLVLGGLGNAFGVVLCLATDGHIGIKFSQETPCSDFFSAESAATGRVGHQFTGLPDDSSQCGPCVDIPIGIGDPARQSKLIPENSKSSVKTPVALASGFSFTSAERVTGRYAPQALRAGNETLSSLRAVVLLI